MTACNIYPTDINKKKVIIIYYMFSNETNLCAACGDFEMQPIEGYTIVQSDTIYNLQDIKLTNGEITKIPPPPFNADTYKKPLYTQIDSFVSQKIQSGFKSSASGNELIYDSLVLDQQNIMIMAKSDVESFEVRARVSVDSEKQIVTLTHDQLQVLLTDLSNWIFECKKIGWNLQSELESLTTKEEIDNFKISN